MNIARLSVFDMSGNNKMKNKSYYKRQATDHESESEKPPPMYKLWVKKISILTRTETEIALQCNACGRLSSI